MKNNNIIDRNLIEQVLADQAVRRILTRESHNLFFHLYFYDYTNYQTAPFHYDLIDISEDESNWLSVVVTFRGSGKSTILSQSYPIWAILGKQQKKCILIVSRTKDQVKRHFTNIRQTLETNELLKQDLGPFQEESDEWGSYSLVIPRFNARIIAVSSEQSIRGMRHGAYRPDLVICDDIEDPNATTTKEMRDRNYNWFTSEILPIGDKKTKFLVVGNLVHNDSVVMRIKNSLDSYPKNTTRYLEVPIADENGTPTWLGKYPTQEEFEIQRLKTGDDRTWQREYMLKIVADEDQIVLPEWIQFYDELPEKTDEFRYTLTTVDLAISEGSTADCTAILTAHVFGYLGEKKIYILPNPINSRIDFPKTIDEIKNIYKQSYYGRKTEIYIEDVGYQKSVIQQLDKEGIYTHGFKVHGQDKRSRLSSVTPLIRQGQVLFPRTGAKDLIQQLVYFGNENHDDLADAFSMMLLQVIEKDHGKPMVITDEIAGLLRGGGGSWYENRRSSLGGGGYYF